MATTARAAEVARKFGAYQDAAVREPIIITKNGRPRTVLLAYEDFVRLSKRDRRVQRAVDLTEEDIAAIEASEMEPGYEHLNAELDAKKCCRLTSGSAGFFRTPIFGTGSKAQTGEHGHDRGGVMCRSPPKARRSRRLPPARPAPFFGRPSQGAARSISQAQCSWRRRRTAHA